MVRPCCVPECLESDKSILAHRIPKTNHIAVKWQEALDLQHHSLFDLQKGFVVCTKHFPASAYRNEISNCLNTTAIPNLRENLFNERAFKKKLTKQNPNVNLDADATRKHLQPNPKRVKREETEITVEIVEPEETFEVYEYIEEAIPLSVKDAEDVLSIVDNEKETQEKQVEGEEAPEVENPKCDQATQTGPCAKETAVIEENIAHEQASKDEKIIGILYPEFQGMNKMQLIEIVNEKNRRIESLEEKVKKLELAMRNLL